MWGVILGPCRGRGRVDKRFTARSWALTGRLGFSALVRREVGRREPGVGRLWPLSIEPQRPRSSDFSFFSRPWENSLLADLVSRLARRATDARKK